MPLYEYLCEKCGQQYESYKRLTEEKKEETCPACGGRAVKMGISLFTAKGTSPGGGSSCGIRPAPLAVRVSVIDGPAVAGRKDRGEVCTMSG